MGAALVGDGGLARDIDPGAERAGERTVGAADAALGRRAEHDPLRVDLSTGRRVGPLVAAIDGGRADRQGCARIASPEPMTADEADPAPSGRFVRWLPPVLLVIVFVALAAMSWRRWPDILVDFGTQLYVPWQLSQGAVLYRDIRQHFGPLSAYVNALLFTIFGVSFRVLFLADLLLLAGIVTLLYRHLLATFDRLTAFASSLVLVAVFGFAQYVGIGNYNYASPYTHEAAHGMALAILLMVALARAGSRPTTRALVLAGLALGATLLTRAELAIATLVYAVCWLALTLPTLPGPRARLAAAFVAATALPPVACALAFALVLPAAQAVRAAAGAWVTLLGSRVATSPFYLEAMGFDRPWANALDVARSAAVALAAATAGFFACRVAESPSRGRVVRTLAGLVPLALLGAAFRVDIVELGRPFPALVLAGLALAAWALARAPWASARRAALTTLLALGVFALALLGKMLLHCRIAHYGFYLAMPAAVFLCVVLLWLVPQLEREARARAAFRWIVVGILVVLSGRYVHHSWTYFARKIFPIGTGADQIISFARDGRALPVTRTLEWIERNMAPEATFTAMPEGIMLNFLTRRRSPVSFTTFMTVDFLAWGEDTAVRELQAAPPDYVVVVHKDTREFGVGLFGRDPRYGKLVMDWVNAHYRPVARFGFEPLVWDAFGIKILERADRP